VDKYELLYFTINSELQILRNRLGEATVPYLADKYEQEIDLLERMLEEAGLEELNIE
jgi:predicted Ser/Thr protein kinase